MSLDSLILRLGAMLGSCVAAIVVMDQGIPQLWALMGLLLAAGIVLQAVFGLAKESYTF